MAMHNPAHPGAILREDVLAALGLSITDAAVALGVSRKTLSRILNERGAVTAEMAMRLELAFGKPNAEHWLKLQTAFGPAPTRPTWPAKSMRWPPRFVEFQCP